MATATLRWTGVPGVEVKMGVPGVEVKMGVPRVEVKMDVPGWR